MHLLRARVHVFSHILRLQVGADGEGGSCFSELLLNGFDVISIQMSLDEMSPRREEKAQSFIWCWVAVTMMIMMITNIWTSKPVHGDERIWPEHTEINARSLAVQPAKTGCRRVV